MHRIIAIAALFACPVTALAQDLCRADVNSTEIVIDRSELGAGSAGLRERARGWPTRGLDRLRNRPPACDSETLIAFLSNEVPEGEIADYCLAPDPTLGFVLVPGERNFRGRCARTTCQRITAAADGAASIAGTAADMAVGREGGESRTRAILHSSGAAILTGGAGSILATLGTGASTAVAGALAAPAIAGAAAVSLVSVGGAVYLCSD